MQLFDRSGKFVNVDDAKLAEQAERMLAHAKARHPVFTFVQSFKDGYHRATVYHGEILIYDSGYYNNVTVRMIEAMAYNWVNANGYKWGKVKRVYGARK